MAIGEGCLAGLKIIELAGIGPAPVCASLLADHGAEVLRIEGPRSADLGISRDEKFDLSLRGRRRIAVDLRNAASREKFMQLVRDSDALLDPLRPGSTEKLGIGPEACLRANPKLVYGRLTGWGQTGPLAATAGHGINYLALTGALHAIGSRERPLPPLNLVADMGGGTMFMAFGLLAACMSAQRTGRGQVVDVAMTDGAIYLSMGLFGLLAEGRLNEGRESNLIDGGAPNYCCYETSDRKHMAVGAAERRFFAVVLQKLGIEPQKAELLGDPARWPELKQLLAAAFRRRTRTEWVDAFAGTDACVSPVLDWIEAMEHPHNRARGNFVEVDGVMHPAPAPQFSGTPGRIRSGLATRIETLDDYLVQGSVRT